MQTEHKYFGKDSIRIQLFRLILAVSLLALSISIAGHTLIEWRMLNEQIERSLTNSARATGIAASAAIVFGDRKAAGEALRTLAGQKEIEAAAIYTLDGRRLAIFGDDRGAPDDTRRLSEHLPGFVLFSRSTTLFQPISFDDSTIGHIYLRASLLDYSNTYWLHIALSIATNLIGLLLAAWLGLHFIDRIVKPVRGLADTSRQVRATKDFSLRAAMTGARNSEIAELIEAFNEMLAEIGQREIDLTRYQTSLERMVQERTEALHTINEELQVAKNVAEAATDAKSRFLAHMSHEIRTPLNAIINIASLMQSDMPGAKHRLFVTTLHQSSLSLLDLVSEILDLAKIEANRFELEHVVFDLHRLIVECVDLIGGPAQQKDLVVSASIAPELPQQAIGDPVRIRQVLNNLLSNALKFTPTGSIYLQATMPQAFSDGFLVRIRVTDTGIGVPADKRDEIFEAFQQADSSMARKYGGSGLGLHIARELALRMGGDITLENIGENTTEGTGATFIFDVTLGYAALTDTPSDQPDNTRTGHNPNYPNAPSSPIISAGIGGDIQLRQGACVLLVEDHIPSQMVMRELLLARGLDVNIASNGIEALERIEEQRPDLILMDCQMPVMDGYEAMLRIRAGEAKNPGQLRLPIVAITANAVQRDLDRCLACGADDVLTKPVMRAGLDRILADWLAAKPDECSATASDSTSDPTPATAPDHPPATVLDRRHLTELRANTSAAGFTAFIASFDTYQGKLLEEIRAALAAGDAAALATALHTFKGGSAYFGAVEVPILCKTLENLARAGQMEVVAERLDELAAAYAQLRQAVESFSVEQDADDA